MDYPNYAAEMDAIRKEGITVEILQRIIRRHQGCAQHMKSLYGRYRTETEDVPIFNRIPSSRTRRQLIRMAAWKFTKLRAKSITG